MLPPRNLFCGHKHWALSYQATRLPLSPLLSDPVIAAISHPSLEGAGTLLSPLSFTLHI